MSNMIGKNQRTKHGTCRSHSDQYVHNSSLKPFETL